MSNEIDASKAGVIHSLINRCVALNVFGDRINDVCLRVQEHSIITLVDFQAIFNAFNLHSPQERLLLVSHVLDLNSAV